LTAGGWHPQEPPLPRVRCKHRPRVGRRGARCVPPRPWLQTAGRDPNTATSRCVVWWNFTHMDLQEACRASPVNKRGLPQRFWSGTRRASRYGAGDVQRAPVAEARMVAFAQMSPRGARMCHLPRLCRGPSKHTTCLLSTGDPSPALFLQNHRVSCLCVHTRGCCKARKTVVWEQKWL